MTFTNDFEAFVSGQKGGQSHSEKKKAASRRNGRKGGRPVMRSLLEKLLDRRLTDAQEEQIEQAAKVHMHIGDIQELIQHFDADDLLTKRYRARRSLPKNLRMIGGILKVVADHSIRAASPYVVEYQIPSPEEQEWWARRYADRGEPPCPPRRVKVDVRRLDGFDYFKRSYERMGNLTVEGIMEGGGAKWTRERAECALQWIQASAAQKDPARQ